MKDDAPSETKQLDKTIDLIKEIAVVSFALVGTWFSMVNTDSVTLPWVLLVLGGAIIYILFLPYKFAVIRDDDIGKIARGRVTSTIAVGSPVWSLIAVTLVLNPQIITDMANAIGNPDNQIFLRPFFLIFIAAMFLIMPIYNKMWRKNLISIIPDIERRSLIEWHSSSFFTHFTTSMLVLDSALLVAAGWHSRLNLSISNNYFTQAIMIVSFLLFFGLFSAWYLRERSINETVNILLEVLIALLTIAVLHFAVNIVVLLLFSTTIILGINSRRKITIQDLERKDKEIDNSVSAQIFDKFKEMHPTLLNILLGLLLVSFIVMYIFILFEIPIGFTVSILIFSPLLLIMFLPIIWAYWTGNVPESLES